MLLDKEMVCLVVVVVSLVTKLNVADESVVSCHSPQVLFNTVSEATTYVADEAVSPAKIRTVEAGYSSTINRAA